MPELGACIYCALDMHDECVQPVERDDGLYDCCCTLRAPVASGESQRVPEGPGRIGRPLKDLEDIKDKTSAGRKRAAAIAPIFAGMECEWAWLRNAGGGVQPIVGCQGNLIQEKGGSDPEMLQGDRHHGPDKSTLNNTPGINLHRVCADCHHRWHSLNDFAYGPSKDRPDATAQWYPEGVAYAHDASTEATDEEMKQSEDWWASDVRGPYPIPLDPKLKVAHVTE